ncbi:uncharacterized protein KY384_003962 [Bacidia gigantensis]|uniref:uncharacterized protein n=1 Tax=Bacidia gigantensis TaxID=2732470 RepID=UPI001D047F27|nr:uncharacterized protein KY384_003962 [Bacidia gigantensis]KAG8532321.1 hypothetical protein KY384_003962 [Bacidia gigantensis]
MRLISTADLSLHEFLGEKIPSYAILSHTWGEEEVSYKQFKKLQDRHLAGYEKIEKCCAIALEKGLQYAWVDTCCIDKSSSAELTEAINSIGHGICLLGLFDVNMPLLYGEGSKAFLRLQYEILQSYDDESIFAWKDEALWMSGLLARSPASFADSGDVVRATDTRFYRKPYATTNQGLHIDLPYSKQEFLPHQRFDVPLRCVRKVRDAEAYIWLSFDPLNNEHRPKAKRAVRTDSDQLKTSNSSFKSSQFQTLGDEEKFFDSYYIPHEYHLKKLQTVDRIAELHSFTQRKTLFTSLTLQLFGDMRKKSVSTLRHLSRDRIGFFIPLFDMMSHQKFVEPLLLISWLKSLPSTKSPTEVSMFSGEFGKMPYKDNRNQEVWDEASCELDEQVLTLGDMRVIQLINGSIMTLALRDSAEEDLENDCKMTCLHLQLDRFPVQRTKDEQSVETSSDHPDRASPRVLNMKNESIERDNRVG